MKKSIRAKFLFFVILVCASLGLMVAAPHIHDVYLSAHLGFTYFEPDYLPPGISIKAKRIDVSHGSIIHGVEDNFRTENWVYGIGEAGTVGSPSAASDDAYIGAADQNYDMNSIQPTCNFIASPKGQRFRLCQ